MGPQRGVLQPWDHKGGFSSHGTHHRCLLVPHTGWGAETADQQVEIQMSTSLSSSPGIERRQKLAGNGRVWEFVLVFLLACLFVCFPLKDENINSPQAQISCCGWNSYRRGEPQRLRHFPLKILMHIWSAFYSSFHIHTDTLTKIYKNPYTNYCL